jgi:hypothetical protein
MPASSRRSVMKPSASWGTSPKRPESPSSSGSTSASSCWRPSTVNLVICLILTQL